MALWDTTPYTGPTYPAWSPFGFTVPGGAACGPGETYRDVGGDAPVCLSQSEWDAFQRDRRTGGRPAGEGNTMFWLLIGVAVFAIFFGSRR